MVEKLEFCDLKQNKLGLCILIGDTDIVVIYIDDLLVWSTEDKYMTSLDNC